MTPQPIIAALPLDDGFRGRFRLLKRVPTRKTYLEEWLAEDMHLRRRVLLKTFPDPQVDARAGRQYAVEEEALSRRLGGLPRVWDSYVEPDGRQTLVREFVGGVSLLEQVERDGPLEPLGAARMGADAASIAESLHRSSPWGLLMCDLYPGNFILDNDRLVYVDLCSAQPLKSQNTALGASTAAIVSPDIVGLGSLVLFLLTGAWNVKDVSIATDLLQSVSRPGASQVGVVVLKALSSRSSAPTYSAGGFRDALLELLPDPATVALNVPQLPLTIHRIEIDECPAVHALRRGDTCSLQWAQLSQLAADLRSETLSGDGAVLPSLDINSYKHQLATANAVLQNHAMSGGAILADEVGLGKTIEALLVLQGLKLRGQAERVLIVVPSQDVNQWLGETGARICRSAFEPGFRVYHSAEDANYGQLIVSSTLFRQHQYRAALLSVAFDLVIVDEAHRLCNVHGEPNALGRAVSDLSRSRTLLLTATPLRNRWRDLYHLANLIRPGYLGSKELFTKQVTAASTDAVERRNLSSLLNGIMIRHRRFDVGDITFPKRSYLSVDLPSCTPEEEFGVKLDGLIGLLKEDVAHERAIVFVGVAAERRDVVKALKHALPNRSVITFQGSFDTRERILETFRDCGDAVVVTSDTGSEGINWQRARTVVHFDVPHSPTIWEQRVGRVYRIGQRADEIRIVHLLIKDGSDKEVYELYRDSLGLLDLEVGESGIVLQYIDSSGDRDFQSGVGAALKRVRAELKGIGVFKGSLKRFQSQLAAARRMYQVEQDRLEGLDLVLRTNVDG